MTGRDVRVRPPALSRRLLTIAAPREVRGEVVGDHEAEFRRLAAEAGEAGARRWYRAQAARSAGPLARMRLRRAARALSPAAIRDDLAQAGRWLVRHPRTALVCIGTLGVAMSAALAATSVLERAVLHPLPFPNADRIVRLWNVGPEMAEGVRSTSLLDVDDWRAATRTMAAVSAYTPHTPTLTGRGDARRLDAMRVGRDFDRVLGVRAIRGRLFEPSEFIRGSHRSVVLTYGFWMREFGGDPGAIDRSLVLDDEPYRIVGVLEPIAIAYPPPKHDVWMPLIARQGAFWENARETGWVTPIGRLADGVSPSEARQELTAIARALALQYPAASGRRAGIDLDLLQDAVSQTSRPVLLLLAAAVVSVLVVAIGNLINLLLAHGERRRREFAVRLALGANRSRLRRQVGLEALLLAGSAGLVALAGAPWMVSAFRALYPGDLPGGASAWRTPFQIACALGGVAASAALLAWPQRRFTVVASRADALRATQRVTAGQRRTRAGLIAAQSALSVVLVVLALVFVRTLQGLAATTPGFDPAGVLVFGITPSPSRVPSADAASVFFDDTLDAVRRVPGVTSAAFAIAVPFVSSGWSFGVQAPGSSGPPTLVNVNAVSSQFLDTLRLPIVSGRVLTDAEQRGASAILINEAAAKLLPGDGPAVGRHVSYSGRDWEIVGVIGDARDGRLDHAGRPWLVLPWKQAGKRPETMIVRTAGDPLATVPAVAAAIHAIDPAVPLAGLTRLSDVVDESVAAERFRAVVVSGLGMVAAILAAIGAYSVTAFAVARQERENGVRLALGESTAALWRRVVLSAMTPAAIGAAAGLAVAWIAARWVQALLFNVDARDPLTLAAAAGAVVALAGCAATPAARRAARIDPAITLRAD